MSAAARLLMSRATAGQAHGRRARHLKVSGGGRPPRRVVVVAAGVRRQDALGIGRRPLDLLPHVAAVRRALVVAPAQHIRFRSGGGFRVSGCNMRVRFVTLKL